MHHCHRVRGRTPQPKEAAHAGRKVALVDKTNTAGGKARTVDRKGYRHEMFGAVGSPAEGSRFHELVDVLGVAERAPFIVSDEKVAATRYRAPDGTWREFVTGLRQSCSPEEIDGIRRGALPAPTRNRWRG